MAKPICNLNCTLKKAPRFVEAKITRFTLARSACERQRFDGHSTGKELVGSWVTNPNETSGIYSNPICWTKMKHMCTATNQFLSVYCIHCIRNIFAILRNKKTNLRSVSFLSGPQKHTRVVAVVSIASKTQTSSCGKYRDGWVQSEGDVQGTNT
jgi:hypothetical protein